MYAQGPINEYQRQQQALINRNYWSVYKHLLPDEREKILCKQPIEIGDKDVYALSDIEGNKPLFFSVNSSFKSFENLPFIRSSMF